MALADSIIVLKDGRIVEKNSPETLLQSSNSIGELGLELMDNEVDDKVVDDITTPQHSQETQDASYDTTEVAEEAEEAETKHTDIRRKQGEASVYTYYLSSSGWVSVGLYSVFVVLWILCIELSSKFVIFNH
jgi:ATP-binding cassette subfamily C (CFTR/MRP) protein 1